MVKNIEQMKISKTIAKLEKATGQKIQTNSVRQHFVLFNGYYISFYPNGRYDNEEPEATNFYTRRATMQDDMQSDYFAGTFHDNITQAINFVRSR